MTFTVSIAGASGYAGGELLRLVSAHPELRLGPLAAGSSAGRAVTAIHPQLVSLAGRTFVPTDADSLAQADLVLMALPHGESAALVAGLPGDLPIVDLGADFRLADGGAWDRYYGSSPHAGAWPYGLPELPGQRERLADTTRVANPGCYATAVALALAPLLAAGLVEPADVVVVAASGTSGAGRKATESLLGSEVMGAMSPYKVGGVHQHTPEMEQALSAAAGESVTMLFTPTLAPMPRGILGDLHRAHRPGCGGGNAARRPARGVRQRAVRARPARGPDAEHRRHGRVEQRAPAGGLRPALRAYDGDRRRGQPRQGRSRPGRFRTRTGSSACPRSSDSP